MDVFDLFAKLSLDSSEYEKGLSDAEKKGSNFGAGLAGAAKAGIATVAAVGTAAIGAGTALVGATSKVAEYGDNIDKASQKMGISAEAYQEWDAVLQHSGTSIDSLKGGFKTLNKAITDVNESFVDERKALTESFQAGEMSMDEYQAKVAELEASANAANPAFEKLGLTVDDLVGTTTESIFATVIERLQEMPDGAERSALATELLGKSAVELGALLNTSAEDTQAMKDRVHELGGVMSDEAVKNAAAFQDSLQDLTTGFDAVKRNLMSDFLPSITTVMDGLTDIFAGDSTKGIETISKGIEEVINNITNLIPDIVQVAVPILESIANALLQNIPVIMPALTKFVLDLGNMIVKNLPLLVNTAMQIILTLSDGISESLPTLIPTIVDVVLQIVNTLVDNIDMLVEAAIALQTGLAEGLIAALPVLLEKAPEIIQKLVDALIDNLPLLVEAALQLVIALQTGIIENLPLIIQAAFEIIGALIKGSIESIPKVVEMGGKIIEELKNAIFKADTKSWGVDMMRALIDGILSMVVEVGEAAMSVANKIAEVLHFSEPDVGPLSNFHTFAPDMMDLFIKGINDNENALQKAVSNAFDFQNLITPPAMQAGGSVGGTAGSNSGTYGEQGNNTAVIILELDKTPLAKAIYNLNLAESRRVGVRLANV